MDAVGKVDRRRAGGQVDHIALRREHEHLVGEHVHLQVVEKVLRVGLLLRLEQAADPGELLLVAGLGALAAAGLVFPVRRDAVLRCHVHLPRADLHLERDALRADDRRVHALVHVRLRRADVILEAAGQRLIHVVDDAEHVVAVGDRVHDDAECAEVKNAVDVELLRVHLAVDAVDVLDAARDGGVYAVGLQALANLRAHLAHELFQRRHAFIECIRDGLVARGVEIQQREVLELPLDLLHAEAVRDGCVDLHRLKGLDALLFLALVGHRAHVVQAVGHLDEDDADVLGHGQEHLAHVLHLLLFHARVLHARELRDALDDVSHRGAEAARDVLVRERGVLDRVVQEGGDDRVLVEPHLRRDDGGGDAVRHVG